MTAASEPGEDRALPPAARRWNWGALWLNVIWGVRHNTDFAYLTLIPVIGLIVPIILGAKGGAWAWRNNKWQSVAHFEKTQKDWAFYGWVVLFFIAVSLFLPVKNWLVSREWEKAPVCTQAVARLLQIEEIRSLVGDNYTWVVRLGGVKHFNRKRARVGIRARGPQGVVQAHLYIMKLDKHWSVYRITLFHPLNNVGIDYPLPEDMLQYGAGRTAPTEPGPTFTVILESVERGQEQNVAKIIARLNGSSPEAAMDLVRRAPQPVLRGATRVGALKLVQKFSDYESVLTMEAESAQP